MLDSNFFFKDLDGWIEAKWDSSVRENIWDLMKDSGIPVDYKKLKSTLPSGHTSKVYKIHRWKWPAGVFGREVTGILGGMSYKFKVYNENLAEMELYTTCMKDSLYFFRLCNYFYEGLNTPLVRVIDEKKEYYWWFNVERSVDAPKSMVLSPVKRKPLVMVTELEKFSHRGIIDGVDLGERFEVHEGPLFGFLKDSLQNYFEQSLKGIEQDFCRIRNEEERLEKQKRIYTYELGKVAGTVNSDGSWCSD